MITRRQFNKLVGTAGVGLLVPWGCGGDGDDDDDFDGGRSLEKYVDALAIPGTLAPDSRLNGETFYRVTMTQFAQKLHRDLPPTTVWGYDGTYPGPTIDARMNELVRVEWINSLPTAHLLTVDPTSHCGDTAPNCSPDVRTTVHVHGGNQPSDSDGYPEDWWLPGESKIYSYPNQQLPTTLWYHDHTLGITRLNVYAGLAGFKIIRDDAEDELDLPSGEFEVPILIQDRTFRRNGSLFYPKVGDVPSVHPNWQPEYFADTAVVNGVVWPYFEVEPRKYRFRILNGCNARFLIMQLNGGPAFTQIGSDGGLFNEPVEVSTLFLAPAERADVVIDFTNYAGQTYTLSNSAPAPFPDGGEIELPEIMQFRVKQGPVADNSVLPAVLTDTAGRIPESQADRTVDFTLDEALDSDEDSTQLLLDNKRWTEPLTDKDMPRLGTTEIWRIINTTGDTHPSHVHLIDFQILDRQPYDEKNFDKTGDVVFTGPAEPPEANEMGWKDTVRCPPGYVTRIIIKWEGFPGRFVWHCHILEHEDNEMMRPLEVLPEL